MHGIEKSKVVNASPSKAFFIEMLTRDISLSDCILDLIDNSIHSLITKKSLDISEQLFKGSALRKINAEIDISFSAERFRIRDNCGGISIDEATEQVFLLGKPVTEKKHVGLGVYGIGMKRAFFKIGRQVRVSSHTASEEFVVEIDVPLWQRSKDWSFSFKVAQPKVHTDGGTTVDVEQLNPHVSGQFALKPFQNILIEKVERAYALFLKAGLRVRINNTEVSSDFPDLAESESLRPVRQLIKKDGVDILVMAGLSPSEDKVPRGWYIFCNGRLVLDADKTERSGWGADSFPAFHVKYNHFLGFVYFRSKDVRKLPWSTTKEDVDRESIIYQAALAEMRVQARPIIDFLNAMYREPKEQNEPEHAVLRQATAIAPFKIAPRKNTTFQVTVKRGCLLPELFS